MDNSYLGAIIYPQLADLPSSSSLRRINILLLRRVRELARKQGHGQKEVSLWGSNETRLNGSGILSLTQDIYSYRQNAAHGLTMRTSVTVNLQTGYPYTLTQLFTPKADYITPISAYIKRQIESKNIPLLREFVAIEPTQEFFLTETDLVIYFATYDYTPYYVGIPEFPIPIKDLRGIINSQSPLHRFLT